jgi:hypothetical protein
MTQQASRSIKDGIQLIDMFLQPVRQQAQKEASMRKQAETSFKDTSEATPQSQAQPKPGSTSQTNLGVEQQQAAEESIGGGQPAVTAKPNSEADANWFSDDQGPKRMDTDQKVTDGGNIGPIVQQEITQEQKMARAEKMANSILSVLSVELQKKASGPRAGGGPGVNAAPIKPPPGSIPNTGMPGKGLGGTRPAGMASAAAPGTEGGSAAPGMTPKTASQQLFDKMASVAAQAAQEYYQGFLSGMLKRGQDEHEVVSSINPQVLDKVGGVDHLLDKVAGEFPEAVLPEGVSLDGAGAPGMDPGADPAAGGLPPEAMAAMAGGEGGAPMEGELPPEAGAEGGEGGGDKAALAQALDQAGVTPEEMQQAFEDVKALREAGVTPEDLASVLQEGGDGGEGGGEGDEAGVPPEASEPPTEEAAEKESAARRVHVIKTLQRVFSTPSR